MWQYVDTAQGGKTQHSLLCPGVRDERGTNQTSHKWHASCMGLHKTMHACTWRAPCSCRSQPTCLYPLAT